MECWQEVNVKLVAWRGWRTASISPLSPIMSFCQALRSLEETRNPTLTALRSPPPKGRNRIRPLHTVLREKLGVDSPVSINAICLQEEMRLRLVSLFQVLELGESLRPVHLVCAQLPAESSDGVPWFDSSRKPKAPLNALRGQRLMIVCGSF
ncbi:hypothetical protein BDW74DRAFT_34241 [Aspergillus multicolor]|uniref:uncharacterized protein n=1 Tax=Aspergillus multicolor TaxID=41759 RepID=UPI003CCD009B